MKRFSPIFGTIALCLIALESDGQQEAKRANCTVIVAQDGSGDINGESGGAIAEAVQRVARAGGGTVKIKAGTYTIHEGICLGPEASDITIEGEGDPVLKFAPQIRAATAADAKPGDTSIKVKDGSLFRAGMRIEIQSPGRTDSFSGKTVQSFSMRVASASEAEITFDAALKYPVPAGTNVVHLLNVFDIDRAQRICIRNLTLDGDAKKEDVRPISHVNHCGIFGRGPYSYEKGPLGEPVRDLQIENCTIRDFFHRGIALYSVVRASVIRCRIQNTQAEAIDFDHFCYHCSATSNSICSAPVGVELNDASYTLVAENEIKDCGIGVNIWQWCRLDNLNVENKILRNKIVNTKTYAIRCAKGAHRNLIEGNTIKGGNSIGIVIQGAENIARNNTITGLGKEALLVLGTGNKSEDNTITNCKR